MLKTVWMQETMFPYLIGFAPDEKAWEQSLKEVGTIGIPYPSNDGMCTFFEGDGGDHDFCIVTVNPRDHWNELDLQGVLVHEAIHCWQRLCRAIGESKPSIEFEAYMVQYIYRFLMTAYQETRHGHSSNKKAAKAV